MDSPLAVSVNLQSCLVNPRCTCARVTVLGLCVCVSVCVSVCLSGTTSPATTHNGASNRRYMYFGAIWETFFKYGVFSALFKSYGVKSQQANKYLLIATSYGADGATFRQKF